MEWDVAKEWGDEYRKRRSPLSCWGQLLGTTKVKTILTNQLDIDRPKKNGQHERESSLGSPLPAKDVTLKTGEENEYDEQGTTFEKGSRPEFGGEGGGLSGVGALKKMRAISLKATQPRKLDREVKISSKMKNRKKWGGVISLGRVVKRRRGVPKQKKMVRGNSARKWDGGFSRTNLSTSVPNGYD